MRRGGEERGGGERDGRKGRERGGEGERRKEGGRREREKRQGGSKGRVRVLGSAYPYPHPSCLLVHPSSLFQLGGFNPTYCFFHVFPSVYTYLCIHTYQLCNKYVTCIVAKHDSRYQVYGMVCSTELHLFMHLLHTGLYTVAHNITYDYA